MFWSSMIFQTIFCASVIALDTFIFYSLMLCLYVNIQISFVFRSVVTCVTAMQLWVNQFSFNRIWNFDYTLFLNRTYERFWRGLLYRNFSVFIWSFITRHLVSELVGLIWFFVGILRHLWHYFPFSLHPFHHLSLVLFVQKVACKKQVKLI